MTFRNRCVGAAAAVQRATGLAVLFLALSGCSGFPGTQQSSGGGSAKESSGNIGQMTGGAEARPTADPGVTPGKKPGTGY